MKAEILSIHKDKDDTILQVRCRPIPKQFVPEDPPDPEILEKMGKSFCTYLEESDERVEKRDNEIAEYNRQVGNLRLGFTDIREMKEVKE